MNRGGVYSCRYGITSEPMSDDTKDTTADDLETGIKLGKADAEAEAEEEEKK